MAQDAAALTQAQVLRRVEVAIQLNQDPAEVQELLEEAMFNQCLSASMYMAFLEQKAIEGAHIVHECASNHNCMPCTGMALSRPLSQHPASQ